MDGRNSSDWLKWEVIKNVSENDLIYWFFLLDYARCKLEWLLIVYEMKGNDVTTTNMDRKSQIKNPNELMELYFRVNSRL